MDITNSLSIGSKENLLNSRDLLDLVDLVLSYKARDIFAWLFFVNLGLMKVDSWKKNIKVKFIYEI